MTTAPGGRLINSSHHIPLLTLAPADREVTDPGFCKKILCGALFHFLMMEYFIRHMLYTIYFAQIVESSSMSHTVFDVGATGRKVWEPIIRIFDIS